MNLLIKGMKKPKDCMDCPFRVFDRNIRKNVCVIDPSINIRLHSYLSGFGREFYYIADCPLIELPDHGDLIDKTDLMASLADWQMSEAPEEGFNWDSGRNVTSHELQYSIYRLLGDVYEEVRDEPVVIPAERSEE